MNRQVAGQRNYLQQQDGELRVMGGCVDIGCDEVGEKQVDVSRNGRIDAADLAIFVQAWLTKPGAENGYLLCDLLQDEHIDFADWATFASDWLWQAKWFYQ